MTRSWNGLDNLWQATAPCRTVTRPIFREVRPSEETSMMTSLAECTRDLSQAFETLTTRALAERVVEIAQIWPERAAVACDGDRLAYRDLVDRATACAARLQDLGLTPGGDDRVGVLAHNSIDYVVVTLACQLSGIPMVPLPVLVTAEAQAGMLADSRVAVLFHDSECESQARAAVALLEGQRRVRLVTMGPGNTADQAQENLESWIRRAASLASVRVEDGWVSDLIYSSGTTGVPKGISQSYGGRKSQCMSLQAMGVTPGIGLLQTVGLYSNFGMSSLLLSLWWGGTLFIMHRFSGAACVEILKNHVVDMAWVAPATLIRITEAEGFKAAIEDRTCIKVCAGAPLGEAQKLQVHADWQGGFFDLYGQTETGTLTLLPIHAAPVDKFSSVGKPLTSVSIRIVDDDGREVAAGDEGEIVAHTSTMMAGYHDRAEANAAVHWRDETDRPFIKTGDIGKFDADGYLWLCDRKKDLIISGGYNVYPADIERAFADHPAVFEVAVVGWPSARWGESPVAFLTLRDGQDASEDDLKTWLNGRVGSVQRVAAVKILDHLPNGSMGKILKRELRDTYAEIIPALP